MNIWLIGIVTGIAGSGITLVLFFLSSSERSRNAAALATTSMQAGMSLQEKLRTAMWKQSDHLSAWENWAIQVQQTWRETTSILRTWSEGNPGEVSLPPLPQLPSPPGHLDLSELFDDASPFAQLGIGQQEQPISMFSRFGK